MGRKKNKIAKMKIILTGALLGLAATKSLQDDQLDALCDFCDEREREDWSCFFPAERPSQYISCGPLHHAHVMDCPEGLVWCQSLQVCGWPESDDCQVAEEKCQTCEDTARTNWECFLPWKKIDEYLSCGPEEKGIVKKCPWGMSWSDAWKRCVSDFNPIPH